MSKKKLTKKKITDMVAYVTILVHNDKIGDVITQEQIDKMMKHFSDLFAGDEEKALGFIKEKVKKFVEELEHDLSI